MTKLHRMALQMVSILVLLASGQVQAHILNETSQFPDIKTSEARFDIVLLVGAGVIPETPQFEPEKKFSRTDLAAWAAQTAGLLKSADKPDIKALASAALEQGLVTSLEGDASYAEINTVFMQGKGTAAQAEATPTRPTGPTCHAHPSQNGSTDAAPPPVDCSPGNAPATPPAAP